ncbi:MAG: hypothetical protein KDI10_03805 [Halioglobus sp.]|nr:hypothetical protein [Halioglobus sp.]MCB1707846.1 hypothetical protein [Halioglobus sp.]MCP5122086.1 hypothetical protein [Pseudomonadales bacterium]MCP5192368.1 hypothetical protein [Pseudomonadales bacterium]
MTNAKLFAKLRSLLEDATNADKKHIQKIRKVLRKLKDRQADLRDSLVDVESLPERQKIEQEIAVITLQRVKGLEVYRRLKNARKLARQGKLKRDSAETDNDGATPGADG